MFAHLNVVVYINTIITAFEFNFDIYQAFRKHEYTLTLKQRETVNKQLFYFQWKLVILKNFEILKSKLKSKIPFYFIDKRPIFHPRNIFVLLLREISIILVLIWISLSGYIKKNIGLFLFLNPNSWYFVDFLIR